MIDDTDYYKQAKWYHNDHVTTATDAVKMLQITAYELEKAVVEFNIPGYRIVQTEFKSDSTRYRCIETDIPSFSIELYGYASFWDGRSIAYKISDIELLRDKFESCKKKHPSSWESVFSDESRHNKTESSKPFDRAISRDELVAIWGLDKLDSELKEIVNKEVVKAYPNLCLSDGDNIRSIRILDSDVERWEAENGIRTTIADTAHHVEERHLPSSTEMSERIQELELEVKLLRAESCKRSQARQQEGIQKATARNWSDQLRSCIAMSIHCLTVQPDKRFTTNELRLFIGKEKLPLLSDEAIKIFRDNMPSKHIHPYGRPKKSMDSD